MSVLKNKEILKMNKEERISKINELRFTLMKGSVSANKAGAKTKEIKRAIARILTHQKANTEVRKQ